MRASIIMVLWTWGITPLWVNIIGTILIALQILIEICEEQK